MLASFLSFLLEKQLLPSPGPTLLAVSGGIDSVVMTHLFHQAKLPFAIAHCNFALRGAESDQDKVAVQNLARQYQVDFYTKTFNVLTYARTHGISTQMAARELRYAWLQECSEDQGFEKVATAHHSNDSLETVLLNLTKGTGIAGLKGVPPVQGKYIRPLLFASKADILQYAKAEGLSWREDSSNKEDDYQRNLLRNQVVPWLHKINPNLETTFTHTAERLSQVGSLFNEQVEIMRQKIAQNHGQEYHLNIQTIQHKTWAPVVLWELLKPFGFQFAPIQKLCAYPAPTGTQLQSPTHALYVNRGQWIITPQKKPANPVIYTLEENTPSLTIPRYTLQCTQVPRSQYQITPDKTVAALNKAQLKFPLTVRPWQPGDAFYPLGMQQRKKLSDFFIDNKVPRPHKAHIWVITSQNEIVWVVGHRIDDRFKLTDQTQLVYQLSLH